MTQDHILLSRRGAMQTLAVGAAALALNDTLRAPALAAAAKGHNPGARWERYAKPQDAGFANDLSQFEETLYPLSTTSLMIVRGGKIAYSYGNTDQISYLASARKSILSMLYGKYVASGAIKLDTTMAELGIDDDVGLTPGEKTATVRHLLMSSSGVYTPQGSPGGNTNTPARGSKKAGEHFHYNNWDFNVAGFVFEKLTGKSVHKALAEDFAGPLQFEDFDINRQRMMGFVPATSRYQAYHMFLSGRDMARLGVLMLNGGAWNGQQIVPAAWVKESTALHVKQANKESGYGYLWWLPSVGRKAPEWAGSYTANGHFGQYIVCLPALDLVVVHRRAVPDEYAIARNNGRAKYDAPGTVNILPIVDQVVAALKA